MNYVKYIMVLLILCSMAGCALSPSRNVLSKGKSVINLSLGGAFVDQISGMENLPLPVNLGVGAFFGITENFTAGATIYPISFGMGSLLIEPAGVYNIMQSNFVKQLNAELLIPTKIKFSGFEVETHPTIGMTPVLGIDKGIVYTALQVQFDFVEQLKLHLNWKLGGEYQVFDHATLGAEVGLLNIGEESVVSPLSRAGIGVPVFSVGSSIDLNN